MVKFLFGICLTFLDFGNAFATIGNQDSLAKDSLRYSISFQKRRINRKPAFMKFGFISQPLFAEMNTGFLSLPQRQTIYAKLPGFKPWMEEIGVEYYSFHWDDYQGNYSGNGIVNTTKSAYTLFNILDFKNCFPIHYFFGVFYSWGKQEYYEYNGYGAGARASIKGNFKYWGLQGNLRINALRDILVFNLGFRKVFYTKITDVVTVLKSSSLPQQPLAISHLKQELTLLSFQTGLQLTFVKTPRKK